MDNALLILLLGSLLTTLWPPQNPSLSALCGRWLTLAIAPFAVTLMLGLLSS